MAQLGKNTRVSFPMVIGAAVALTAIAVIVCGMLEMKLCTDAIDLASVAKGEDVIGGIAKLVYARQKQMMGHCTQFARVAASARSPFASPAQAVLELNASLFARLSALVGNVSSVTGASVRVLFLANPTYNLSARPRQNKTVQQQCDYLCAREGDPTYSAAAAVTLFRDVMQNRTLSWWGFSDGTGMMADGYEVTLGSEGLMTPPTLGKHMWNYTTMDRLANGSYEDGVWTRPLIQITQDKSVSYYFTYTRQYYMPLHDAMVVAKVYGYAEDLLDVTLKLSSDDLVVVTDDMNRVLAYTGSPRGDAPLRNCTAKEGVPFFSGQCADIAPWQQSNPIVRTLLTEHGETIRASREDPCSQFVTIGGTRYVMTNQRIMSVDAMTLIVTFVSRTDTLYGHFRRSSLITTIVCACLVFCLALVLGVLGVVLVRRSTRTILMTLDASKSLAVLDTDGAVESLESAEACNADPDVRQLLLAIASHLKYFKPFFSQALIRESPQEDAASPPCDGNIGGRRFNASLDTCELLLASSKWINDEPCFRARRGTVALIKLDGRAGDGVLAVTRFHECVHSFVAQEGGIVEQMCPTSVVATFNYHQTVVMHQAAAGRAVQKAVAQLGYEQLKVAAAIVSSTDYVATFGSTSSKARAVAGNGVDMAEKLIQLCDVIGVRILMNEQASAAYPAATLLVDVIAPRSEDHAHHKTVSVFAPLSLLGLDADAADVYSKALSLLRVSNVADATAALRQYIADVKPRSASHLRRLLEVCEQCVRWKGNGYARKELWWECAEAGWEAMRHAGEATDATGLGGVGPQHPTSELTPIESDAPAARFPDGSQRDGRVAVMPSASEDAKSPSLPNNVLSRDCCPFSTIFDNCGEEWRISRSAPLGRGRSASVYLASSTKTGRMAALKLFKLSSSEPNTAALMREVDVLLSLQNPNIASYTSHCITRTHSHFGVFMEYQAASSLRSYLSRFGPVPPAAARCYFVDILLGLSYLHERYEAHMNIKPENVLITTEGTCKLTDFGTAKLASMSSSSQSVLGAARYTAPEALCGNKSTKADVWSVGVVFVEMLCGAGPFSHIRGDDAQFVAAIRERPDEFVPRYALPVETGPAMRSIIESCLRCDPAQRPHVGAVLQQLE